MSHLVNATVASCIMSPDPKTYIDLDDDKKGKTAKDSVAKPDSKPEAKPEAKPEKKPLTADERFYAVDNDKLQKLRTDKPWTKPESSSGSRPMAKYFETISIGPSAVTKMMMHCQSGVDKGISKGGNPIEVMGLMLGRPDPHKPTNLIVTDAFPLPIEGFETRVVADDQEVVNHMISLGERLEQTRNEKFMGWYHSHPFDLVLGEDSRSHCFLSQTDLSTQLQWQRAEDPHGNPFAAIVVDPLLSMHTGTPQLKAFRAYPPEYQSAIVNECPDGSVVNSEKKRLEKWGSCWSRYYELKVEYYMSEASRSILGDLTQEYLWMKAFQRDSKESGIGETRGVSVSEISKVTAIREIASDFSTEIKTGSDGRTSALPISQANKIEPLVHRLQEQATIAMTQQTARIVQTNVFAPNRKEDSKEEASSGPIATTVTN